VSEWSVSEIEQDTGGLEKQRRANDREGGCSDYTGSIASSNEFDTALYKERPPSDGMYADTASATTASTVLGDNDRACSPPCRNKDCEASASFSSVVKGTKGKTVVTREINEAPRHLVTSGLSRFMSSIYSFLSIGASGSALCDW